MVQSLPYPALVQEIGHTRATCYYCCYSDYYCYCCYHYYAQTSIVVAFLVFNIFSCWIITRSHEFGFGRNLVEILPTGLPELFLQPRDLDTSQEVENMKF